MKAVCFREIGVVQTLEIDQPRLIDPLDAIVKVELAGLCGSDLHPFFGREAGLDVGTVMGHEMVGTIIELGTAAQAAGGLQVGDRVYAPFTTSCGGCYFCQIGLTARCLTSQLFGWRSAGKGLHGCQAEYVRIPQSAGTLLKVPSQLSPQQALLLGDNFSTGFYCAEMAEIHPEGSYAVIGCGTVGQLCLQVVRQLGCEQLFAIDPVAERRDRGTRWGAIPLHPDQSAAAIMSATAGRGVDGVMELVGLPEAQSLAFQLVRPGGTLSVIGCHCTPNFAFSPVDAYDKNLTYRTGRCSARHYMQKLQSSVVEGMYDLSDVITHEFSPNESKRAYEIFSQQKEGCIKAVFNFD